MKMNNKGYMLIEIILASAIAFSIAYFVLDLTIKLKNKNDDLYVETLVATDKTIIMNKLMDKIINSNFFNCSSILQNNINNINNNVIEYENETIDIVNEYTKIGIITCNNTNEVISIEIPLSVKQINDKNFNIVINYKK